MAWRFPEKGVFDLEMDDGAVFNGCRFTMQDQHHLTVEAIGNLGMKYLLQVRKREIRRMWEWPPLPEERGGSQI